MFEEENTGINFDAYEDIPVETSGRDCPEPMNTFQDCDMPESLALNVGRCKYSKPTPVQRHAIPVAMAGRDLMACAQTGSGKTAAFCFPTIAGILALGLPPGSRGRKVYPSALILSPTRELASQTDRVILAIGDYMSVQTHCCVGGKSIGEDIRRLDHGVHVVSGTPGRVYDMIKRRTLRTRQVRLLVLDEADEMLNRGFKEQIFDIYRYLPPETQVVLVSATLPREVLQVTDKFMTDPVKILVKRDELTLEGIK